MRIGDELMGLAACLIDVLVPLLARQRLIREIHRACSKSGAGNAVRDATLRSTALLKAKREFDKPLIANAP
jgi:hypothetical protein